MQSCKSTTSNFSVIKVIIVKIGLKILSTVITASQTAAIKLPHMAQTLNNRKHVTPVKYLSATENK